MWDEFATMSRAWAPVIAACIALVATVIGGVIAVGWPTWRSRQIGRRFVGLIRRELEEIGPRIPKSDPDAGRRPWWEYLSKRFVHEEFLGRERIAEHRDFVLSLDPTLVYLLSQLWISYEKRDLVQWKQFLNELAANEHVATTRLKDAADRWNRIEPDAQTTEWVRGSAGQLRSPVEQVSGLFEARLDAYRELTSSLTSAAMADEQGRSVLVNGNNGTLRVWYRTHGLLLSGDALHRYLHLRDLLEGVADPGPLPLGDALRDARSALCTELKIDLGVRHPDERDEPTDGARRRG
ncbi:hypothetical protein [Agromyces humatus]|uniref:Uncharacterized protein n=1 Tax=Agromyces humatus TaxID=279573 RepID=A0ABP4WVP1_9MICO|nr:hypothetical protein [Agromyces humatus]